MGSELGFELEFDDDPADPAEPLPLPLPLLEAAIGVEDILAGKVVNGLTADPEVNDVPAPPALPEAPPPTPIPPPEEDDEDDEDDEEAGGGPVTYNG